MFEKTDMRAVRAEFLGTFFLVFIGLSVADGGDALNTALAFGIALMGLMMVIGPVSGCHVNPAVTLGNYMSRNMDQDDTVAYLIGQGLGATVAAFAMSDDGVSGMDDGNGKVIVTAFVGTAFFMMVLMNVTKGGFDIGSSWAAGGALFLVVLLGFDVNPALDFGGDFYAALTVDGTGFGDIEWNTVAGPVLGAVGGIAIWDNLVGD